MIRSLTRDLTIHKTMAETKEKVNEYFDRKVVGGKPVLVRKSDGVEIPQDFYEYAKKNGSEESLKELSEGRYTPEFLVD